MSRDDDLNAEPQPAGMSRRSALTRVALGAGAVWAAPVLLSTNRASASAPGTAAPATGTFHNTINNNAYQHDYNLTYACGSAGSGDVGFTGSGGYGDPNIYELITGNLNTTSGAFTFTSTYYYTSNNAPTGYDYSVSGTGTPTGATFTYTDQTGTNGVTESDGTFTGVPTNCP